MGTALVLGATGGIGGEVAATLVARGWTVRALHRKATETPRRSGIEWVAGDAMDAASVVLAARGAELIVHAVNPPGYRRWAELVLPMLDSTLAAARETGARILLPGTIYNYGPDAFPLLSESSPQHPRTEKGAIRVEMERRLQAAADRGEARAMIVRAGDFFGPRPGNNWFAQALVRAGRPVRLIRYPGRRGGGHAWAYLPDLAETMVRLAESETLDDFEMFNFGGHWDPDGRQMINAIREAVGRPDLPVRRFPWMLVAAASPFVPFFREIWKMRYLWREPLQLDNRKLVARLGAEPHTSLDMAVVTTLAGLGCLSVASGNGATARVIAMEGVR